MAIKKTRKEESFSVLVAPVIHQDTIEAAAWQKKKNKVDILTYNIIEFIQDISSYKKASELLISKANTRDDFNELIDFIEDLYGKNVLNESECKRAKALAEKIKG